MDIESGNGQEKTVDASYRKATFAGGCFWCMEPPFEKMDGVIAVVSGYTGGKEEDPAYEDVASGRTGHAEAIQVTFDPQKVSYAQLLEVFWKNINPTQVNGQFVDVGRQYRTAVFYHDEEQKHLAVESRNRMAKSGKFEGAIATEILPAGPFYPAEEYHQEYHLKNPVHYKTYRFHSGRDQYLMKTWKTTARD